MSTTPLDFSLTDLASLKTEVDTGLAALISALDVVEKFSVLFPPSVKVELAAAVSVLTTVKALVDKFA